MKNLNGKWIGIGFAIVGAVIQFLWDDYQTKEYVKEEVAEYLESHKSKEV